MNPTRETPHVTFKPVRGHLFIVKLYDSLWLNNNYNNRLIFNDVFNNERKQLTTLEGIIIFLRKRKRTCARKFMHNV